MTELLQRLGQFIEFLVQIVGRLPLCFGKPNLPEHFCYLRLFGALLRRGLLLLGCNCYRWFNGFAPWHHLSTLCPRRITLGRYHDGFGLIRHWHGGLPTILSSHGISSKGMDFFLQ